MAARLVLLRGAGGNNRNILGFKRWNRSMSHHPPLVGSIIDHGFPSTQPALPEFYRNQDNEGSQNNFRFGYPSYSFGGSMEVMAVPKRKVTPHKRGIRNGPKALKPVPVIIRCKSCGRVKLPHFFCCSGYKGSTGEQNSSTN